MSFPFDSERHLRCDRRIVLENAIARNFLLKVLRISFLANNNELCKTFVNVLVERCQRSVINSGVISQKFSLKLVCLGATMSTVHESSSPVVLVTNRTFIHVLRGSELFEIFKNFDRKMKFQLLILKVSNFSTRQNRLKVILV